MEIMCRFPLHMSVAFAAILWLAGCTKTLEFRVVDAATRQPLSGVQVSVRSMTNNLLSAAPEEQRQLPPTGVDGRVVASDLRQAWYHMLVFTKEGCFDAVVHTRSDDLGQVLLVSSATPGWQDNITVLTTRGVVTVPLYPATQPHSQQEQKSGT